MTRLLGRALAGIVLLAMAGSLIWYGIWTNRVASKDLDFIKEHSSTELFPEALILKGNLAYYVDLDPESAIGYYRRAISSQPLLIDAWLALAKIRLTEGREEQARETVGTLAPLIAHVSTWKWQELLLAYEMRDDDYFTDCFNFILARLPQRVKETCYLALSYWGSWEAGLAHLAPEARTVYLNELMKAKQADVALALWKEMEASPEPPDEKLKLSFCQFLLGNGRVGAAKEVWKSSRQSGDKLMQDGGFESLPLNAGFGWRWDRHPEVVVERSLEAPHAGAYSLHLHFRGTKNLSFGHVTQIIPVEPGKAYRLKFAQKSRNLTTDQGVFLAVSGYRCKGLSVLSEAVLGTRRWGEEELEFTVPDACEAISLQVRRKESLKFDSKIAGDYWLDALELEEKG